MGSEMCIRDRYISDTWKCGSLRFIFTHPPEDKKKKTKNNRPLALSKPRVRVYENVCYIMYAHCEHMHNNFLHCCAERTVNVKTHTGLIKRHVWIQRCLNRKYARTQVYVLPKTKLLRDHLRVKTKVNKKNTAVCLLLLLLRMMWYDTLRIHSECKKSVLGWPR